MLFIPPLSRPVSPHNSQSNVSLLQADNFCYNEVEYLYDTYLSRDEYDFRELTPDPFPPNFYVDYLNTAKVQQAIGAYVNYSDSSGTVGASFGETGDDDRNLTAVSGLLDLYNKGVRVVMYFGDADYICNWIGGYAVAQEAGIPGLNAAGFVNMSTSDGIVHGYVILLPSPPFFPPPPVYLPLTNTHPLAN